MADFAGRISVYCDGAYYPRHNWSVIGAIVVNGNHRKNLLRWTPENNSTRAEFRAALMALDWLQTPCEVYVFTDYLPLAKEMRNPNRYVHHPINRTSLADLWERLDERCAFHSVKWYHLPGHSTYDWNNQVHDMVTTFAKRCEQAIRRGLHPPMPT